MSDLCVIRCKGNFHLAQAVSIRACELGYTITHPSVVEADGLYFKTDTKYQITDRSNEEDEDIVNLDDFFNSDRYKFQLPPVKVRVTSGHTATVHSDHIKVGCKRIEYAAVKEIYEAMMKLRQGESE